MHITSKNRAVHCGLLELPGELIRLIIGIIYHDGYEKSSALFAVANTCKALRSIAMSLMFHHRRIQLHSGYLDGQSYKYFQLITHPSCRIAEHVVEVRIDDSQDAGIPYNNGGSYTTDVVLEGSRIEATHIIRDGLKAMRNLRTVRFNPYGVFSSPFVEDLALRSIHIVLDQSLRKFSGCFDPTFFNKSTESQPVWSLATNNGKIFGNWVHILSHIRLRALEWSLPSDDTDPSHLQILDELHGNTYLEELQVSEKVLDLQEQASSVSHTDRICSLITSLPCLRRLSVEGSKLTASLLTTIAQLTTLEDLRIYSSYRAAFHPDCTTSECPESSATEMPWLQLPNLRKLDIRFICKHFTLQQLVPRGLKALRLEFYGAVDRVSESELNWLAQTSPGLETLQIDVGNLNDVYVPAPALSIRWGVHQSEATALFWTLTKFKRLRMLRLFPSYWKDGSMIVSPLQNSFQLAYMFRSIQKHNPRFRKLYVCISYGEYPFDLVPRMAEHNRPWKYVMTDVGNGDLCLQSGFGAKALVHEMIYTANNGIVTRGMKTVEPRAFIDDLTGWILPHYDLSNEVSSLDEV